MTSIKVPPEEAHTPAAQAIANVQTELKRYKKQENKTPAAWRRVKIQALEEQLLGLANSQGWLGKAGDAGTEAQDEDDEEGGDKKEEEMEQVYPPGLKTYCMTYCGICPCPYCQDTHVLAAAQKELQELQDDRADIMRRYCEKGLTEQEANASWCEKVAAADAKVAEEDKAIFEKARQKMGSAIGFCQTAVAAPCAVGL